MAYLLSRDYISMEEKIIKLLKLIRSRKVGIEHGTNLLIYNYFTHITYNNALARRIISEELIDILESVQCYLLEIEDGKGMIKEIIERYEEA